MVCLVCWHAMPRKKLILCHHLSLKNRHVPPLFPVSCTAQLCCPILHLQKAYLVQKLGGLQFIFFVSACQTSVYVMGKDQIDLLPWCFVNEGNVLVRSSVRPLVPWNKLHAVVELGLWSVMTSRSTAHKPVRYRKAINTVEEVGFISVLCFCFFFLFITIIIFFFLFFVFFFCFFFFSFFLCVPS